MLIVARYNENLDWIKNINLPHTIYNKGEDIESNEYLSVVPLINKGRESDTYLRFIIDNYDTLPENIIFCQGNPFEHCSNFIEIVHTSFDTNTSVTNLSHWIVTEDLHGNPYAAGYGMTGMLEKLNIPLTVTEFVFPAGAQYIVNKYNIINKSKEWWVRAYEQHDSNVLSPWIFERLWPIIFLHNES